METDSVGAYLKSIFGFDSFRNGQEEIVQHILAGQDVLGIMPTGAGKSICYQLPAVLLNGLTLVISPLVSLMYDQVMALKQVGIRGAYLNSSLTATQQRIVLERAAADAYDILYIAPERLQSDGFLAFAARKAIPMITIDEAHCISQWGHNFRPDYLQIRPFIESFPIRPVVSAFTATATEKVRKDIIASLNLQNPFIQINPLDRPNLFFEVRRPQSKMREIDRFLASQHGKSGIIYCSTRKNVEDLCEHLLQSGQSATRYHAGLTDAERSVNQDDFIYDRKPIIVATNAFGMGIDKSNVSFVVHYNMPKNLESYYQEAGRAGRDGMPANCLILYSAQDVVTAKFLIEKTVENSTDLSWQEKAAQKKRELALLDAMINYCTTTACLRYTLLHYFGEPSEPHCGGCGNCLTVFEKSDITIEVQKVLSCVYRMGERGRYFGRAMIADVLHGSDKDELTRRGLNTLSTYGIMRDQPVSRIFQVMDWLIENEALVKTESEFPVIRPTEKARSLLKAPQPILASFAKEPERLPRSSRAQRKNMPAIGKTDGNLYAQLRELRTNLAKAQRVPAYVIFSDATLQDLARTQPLTVRDFGAVKGVGQMKLEKYAHDFITVIKRFKAEQHG